MQASLAFALYTYGRTDMSEFKFLKFEKANGVARITFARPKHNVMNIDMMNELNCLFEDAGV